MHILEENITTHNTDYIDRTLAREKEYFDNILLDIDPKIRLDDEQRRAVITDDDYCLLVAGAGAGKTTTMAAKVKYLVEKKNINPEEIIVISYTNKAIGELRERINKGLKIPAKICTFHAFAFEIVKRFSVEPPEINFSSYQIVFDMLEKSIFNNKQLMRNLVLFLGYYFDLTEDVFKFDNLNQFHLYKAAQDYETLKSGLGEYIKKVEQQRSKRVKQSRVNICDRYKRCRLLISCTLMASIMSMSVFIRLSRLRAIRSTLLIFILHRASIRHGLNIMR